MTRIEELTLKLLDEAISDPEVAELEALVESSAAGVNDHFLLLDIEAGLRGQAPGPDVRRAVLARLAADGAAETQRAVLRSIAELPAPRWLSTPADPRGGALRRVATRLRTLAAVALFVLTATALLIAWRGRGPSPGADRRMRVVAIRGHLEILAPGQQSRIARVGQSVAPGETLRMGTEDGFAVVEFSDRTRLDLSSSSTVRLMGEETSAAVAGAGKCVALSSGVLRADVVPQPAGESLLIQTPVADVRVPGSASFLSVTTPECTWVDLANGRAEMVRKSDGRQFAIEAGSSATVRADVADLVVTSWERPRPRPRHRLEFTPAHTIAFSREGSILLAANSRVVYKFSLITGEEKREPIPTPFEDGARAALSRDGKTLAISRADGLSVWETSWLEQRLALPAGGLPSRQLVLAADGSWLAAQNGDPSRSSELFLWDTSSGRLRAQLHAGGTVRNLASSADGGSLLAGTRESLESPTHRILLWDAVSATPRERLVTDLPASWQAVLSDDGVRLATVGSNGVVQIWNLTTRSIERVIDARERPVRSLAFTPDGQLLAGGTLYGSVLFWDVATGQERTELKADQRGVRLLAFSPDGKSLATGTVNDPILIWDVPTLARPEAARGVGTAEPDRFERPEPGVR